jgi:hypothetical protein
MPHREDKKDPPARRDLTDAAYSCFRIRIEKIREDRRRSGKHLLDLRDGEPVLATFLAVSRIPIEALKPYEWCSNVCTKVNP